MTVSTMQLGVCSLYALLLWLAKLNPIKLFGLQAPDSMPVPKLKMSDVMATIPVGCAYRCARTALGPLALWCYAAEFVSHRAALERTVCSACAHSAGVVCLGADPLFGQIVKAGEPVLSALVNTVFYGKPPSTPKFVCLFFIVAGVAFASLKKDAVTNEYKLKFDERALLFGMIGNAFAAFKGSENKKLMSMDGVKDRFGGVANQFATTEVLAFLISVPVMMATEGAKWGEFMSLMKTSRELQVGLFVSGLSFYLYNELATMTIKATGAVTSYAHTHRSPITNRPPTSRAHNGGGDARAAHNAHRAPSLICALHTASAAPLICACVCGRACTATARLPTRPSVSL
jgi:solute carrier family 35 protein E1